MLIIKRYKKLSFKRFNSASEVTFFFPTVAEIAGVELNGVKCI